MNRDLLKSVENILQCLKRNEKIHTVIQLFQSALFKLTSNINRTARKKLLNMIFDFFLVRSSDYLTKKISPGYHHVYLHYLQLGIYKLFLKYEFCDWMRTI